MSRKTNVNPDHYKTAGRLRPGDPALQDLDKQLFGERRARLRRTRKK